MAAGRLGASAAGRGSAATFYGLLHKRTEKTGVASQLDAFSYSVWASAFGSHGRTNGDAAIGSAQRAIDDTHLATGIDMRLTPDTIAASPLPAARRAPCSRGASARSMPMSSRPASTARPSSAQSNWRRCGVRKARQRRQPGHSGAGLDVLLILRDRGLERTPAGERRCLHLERTQPLALGRTAGDACPQSGDCRGELDGCQRGCARLEQA